MGKTHLMHAIGHEVKRRLPHAAISYVSGEKFVNELIDSLRYNKMTSFRDKFRSVDVLLIDDVQFLAGKERMQEEFFHTFNALHEDMKQIVIASDRPPKELEHMEDRLRSRFEWGLIADIQPPGSRDQGRHPPAQGRAGAARPSQAMSRSLSPRTSGPMSVSSKAHSSASSPGARITTLSARWSSRSNV